MIQQNSNVVFSVHEPVVLKSDNVHYSLSKTISIILRLSNMTKIVTTKICSNWDQNLFMDAQFTYRIFKMDLKLLRLRF